MRVAIVYNNFMDPEGKELAVGGVETYLNHLAKLCVKKNMRPTVYQAAMRGFQEVLGDVKVVGVQVPSGKDTVSKLVQAAIQEIDLKKDMVVFGADRFAKPIGTDRCVSIQHGISWDLPMSCHLRRKGRVHSLVGDRLYQVLRRLRAIRHYQACPNRVCVDYNYLNWYRTYLHSETTGKDWVILNFTRLASQEDIEGRSKKGSNLQVLFARRFDNYRGTRIMAEATKNILCKFPEVKFTFAGGGADEDWLRNYFEDESRVFITKYRHDEVIDVHLRHDIAVVPSLGSEGSSLSVAEAMGCGCAVLATAVGGITNMIIDGHNGLLCLPTSGQLQLRLEELISNNQLRLRVGTMAYETAKGAFSLERWEKSWSSVIDEIIVN